MAKAKAPIINEASQADFQNLGNLVAIIDEATAQIGTLQEEVDTILRDEIESRRKEVTTLQATLLEAKQAAGTLCRKHRHWFGDKQSLALLNGTCSFRASASLKVPNELAAIKLIKAELPPEDAGRYVRTSEVLDKESLEKLDDKELAKFGIIRVAGESFDVKPRKVDLAKAAAAEPQKEAA